MKNLIPWVIVIALLGGAAWLYSANARKDVEIAGLRAQSHELEMLRDENAELKKSQVSAEEITRLRKDAEDVLRLRNEVRQLRDQSQQAAKQLQSALAGAQQQQAQLQKLQTENKQAIASLQQSQQARAATATDATAVINTCINQLRQLDGAKQQWALENRKDANATPTAEQVAVYLKDGVIPVCPAGGTYTIGKVADLPTCSIPGHALPQQ